MNTTHEPEKQIQYSIKTANSYMKSAIRAIDEQFKDGYAEKHPELISGFMQTIALDFLAESLSDRIVRAIHNSKDE